MPFKNGYNTASGSTDFKIPVGSRITGVYCWPYNLNADARYTLADFYFGYGKYAVASIVPATNKLYVHKYLTCGNTDARNFARELEINPNILSIDENAFVYMVIGGTNPEYAWWLIVWEDPDPSKIGRIPENSGWNQPLATKGVQQPRSINL